MGLPYRYSVGGYMYSIEKPIWGLGLLMGLLLETARTSKNLYIKEALLVGGVWAAVHCTPS
jgi:hypothetical protein